MASRFCAALQTVYASGYWRPSRSSLGNPSSTESEKTLGLVSYPNSLTSTPVLTPVSVLPHLSLFSHIPFVLPHLSPSVCLAFSSTSFFLPFFASPLTLCLFHIFAPIFFPFPSGHLSPFYLLSLLIFRSHPFSSPLPTTFLLSPLTICPPSTFSNTFSTSPSIASSLTLSLLHLLFCFPLVTSHPFHLISLLSYHLFLLAPFLLSPLTFCPPATSFLLITSPSYLISLLFPSPSSYLALTSVLAPSPAPYIFSLFATSHQTTDDGVVHRNVLSFPFIKISVSSRVCIHALQLSVCAQGFLVLLVI